MAEEVSDCDEVLVGLFVPDNEGVSEPLEDTVAERLCDCEAVLEPDDVRDELAVLVCVAERL